MEDAMKVLTEFGVVGLWGIVLYQLLDILEIVVVFLLLGYGLKKAWPAIKEKL